MSQWDFTEYSQITDLEERARVISRPMWMIWEWDPNGRLKYLEDYARIVAFLSDRQLFEATFRKVDADISKRFWTRYLTTKNWLSTTFRDLFEKYGSGGFVPGENIVMVGSAFKAFGPIVSSGYLFKDGTGPDHGEYTHTLQWLTVARALHDRTLSLRHNVNELYRNSTASGSLSKATVYALTPKPGKRKIGLWEYLVDCFPDPESEGNLYKNILSSTYRTPSELTKALRSGGSLEYTFMRIWLEIREEERGWVDDKRTKEEMRQYHIKKQVSKEKVVHLDKKKGFNTFFPKDIKVELKEELTRRKMEGF